MFTSDDYEALHKLVFRPDYPGYKPTVVEIPNGDGRADTEKRFAHVAPKYFANEWQEAALMPYLRKAHDVAEGVADFMSMPDAFRPDIRYGALRILDYPPGAVSNKHKDFDLFTLMMFRDQPDRFAADEVYAPTLKRIQRINEQAHIGELGQEIGLGLATPHEVLPSATRQRSIVYFAIPDHDTMLPVSDRWPTGVTVRDWLNERMARSRTVFKAY